MEEPRSPHGEVGLVPGESGRVKPGTCPLDRELLTVVAEGAVADVQELHQRFDHELTLMLFRLLVSTV